jgi:hypothetical protein
MLDTLFKFPIVMVDGDNEEKKHKLGLPNEEAVDIITGEAECPYYDLISITDRWLPTEDSFQNAMEGTFDACYVIFGASGSFVVPWNKEKFKEEYRKFMAGIEVDPETSNKVRLLSKKGLRDLADEIDEDE